MKFLISSVCLIFLSTIKCNPIGVEDEPAPYESGDKWQGDIILTPEQEDLLNGSESGKGGRTGLLSASRRWPKSNGLVYVPYTFATSAGYTANEKRIIESGLQEISRVTCVRFVPRSSQRDYVEIINDRGCYSYLGRIGGKQPLSLYRFGCVYKGTAMHEFIHALGYTHMQNRADRDNFVTVRFENIQAGVESNFQKVNSAFYGDFGTAYDYSSVMHYSRTAFSKNGRETITPKNGATIGNRSYLTSGDVQRIRNMYQC